MRKLLIERRRSRPERRLHGRPVNRSAGKGRARQLPISTRRLRLAASAISGGPHVSPRSASSASEEADSRSPPSMKEAGAKGCCVVTVHGTVEAGATEGSRGDCPLGPQPSALARTAPARCMALMPGAASAKETCGTAAPAPPGRGGERAGATPVSSRSMRPSMLCCPKLITWSICITSESAGSAGACTGVEMLT